MIVFDELRITNDAQTLIIDARIRKEKIYKDVRITNVVVGTHKTYEEGSLNGNGTEISFTELNEYGDADNRILLRLQNIDLNPTARKGDDDYIDLKEDLIYVYVNTTPLNNSDCPDLPCDMMQTHNIGVTMYMGNIYNIFMHYMDELNHKSCDNQVPQNLIDLILKYTALTAALDSKHFIKANEFYKKWFSVNDYTMFKSNCGCNG